MRAASLVGGQVGWVWTCSVVDSCLRARHAVTVASDATAGRRRRIVEDRDQWTVEIAPGDGPPQRSGDTRLGPVCP